MNEYINSPPRFLMDFLRLHGHPWLSSSTESRVPLISLYAFSEEMVMRTFVFGCWLRAETLRVEENPDEYETQPEFYY